MVSIGQVYDCHLLSKPSGLQVLKQGGEVLAIERDREIAPVLRQVFDWADGLEVREADAAKLDYEALRVKLPDNVVPAYDGMVIEV